MKLFIQYVQEYSAKYSSTIPENFIKIFCDSYEFRNKWYTDAEAIEILGYQGENKKKRQTLKNNLIKSFIEGIDYKIISSTADGTVNAPRNIQQFTLNLSYKTLRALMNNRKDLMEYLYALEDILFDYMDYQKQYQEEVHNQALQTLQNTVNSQLNTINAQAETIRNITVNGPNIYSVLQISILRQDNIIVPQIICTAKDVDNVFAEYRDMLNRYYHREFRYVCQVIRQDLTIKQAVKLRKNILRQLTGYENQYNQTKVFSPINIINNQQQQDLFE